MRLSRVLALLVVIFTAIASSMLNAGCGGTDPSMITDDGGATDGPTVCTTRGTIDIDQVCNTDCDCMGTDALCTKAPYDRKTMPVCTYKCDPANPNPLCPMGCNMKGYCKLQ
jgi:hypothetical protein